MLTVYGIETPDLNPVPKDHPIAVATVLTVYGIETQNIPIELYWHLGLSCNSAYRLRY